MMDIDAQINEIHARREFAKVHGISSTLELLSSPDIGELAAALAAAQGKIKNVAKDVSGYQYKYADLGGCINAIKEPLKENNLALTQLISKAADGELVLFTILMHSSGQWIKSYFPLNNQPDHEEAPAVAMGVGSTYSKAPKPPRYSKIQGLGSVITYARRYSLAAIIGLAQEDDETQLHSSTNNNSVKTTVSPPPRGALPGPVLELQKLCEERKVNLKDFANFHAIVSSNLPQVQKVVNEFEAFHAAYLNGEVLDKILDKSLAGPKEG